MNTTKAITILYHANCIDGWFAAFLADSYYCHEGVTQRKMIPMTPGQPSTWPAPCELAGTDVLLVDVSVDASMREQWIDNGALSVKCIDHHESAQSHWPAENSPIHTHECAALQVARHFCRDEVMPEWLMAIDRVDRWDHPTYEDRCLREQLLLIAHLPCQKKHDEAIQQTIAFIALYDDPELRRAFLAEGEIMLYKKEEALKVELCKGVISVVGDKMLSAWNLPSTWKGISVYILDTSHVTIDSTEAAHVVFQHCPEVDVYINYRHKYFYSRGVSKQKKNDMIVYSARSREFVLTSDGSPFKGHPTSAGASILMNPQKDVMMPFFPLRA